jgi:hypothetical protein
MLLILSKRNLVICLSVWSAVKRFPTHCSVVGRFRASSPRIPRLSVSSRALGEHPIPNTLLYSGRVCKRCSVQSLHGSMHGFPKPTLKHWHDHMCCICGSMHFHSEYPCRSIKTAERLPNASPRYVSSDGVMPIRGQGIRTPKVPRGGVKKQVKRRLFTWRSEAHAELVVCRQSASSSPG